MRTKSKSKRVERVFTYNTAICSASSIPLCFLSDVAEGKFLSKYICKFDVAGGKLLSKYIYKVEIRKGKDYVYGIWVYKSLDIWKGYYRVKKSLVSYVKPWTEARNNKYMKYHSKLTYQLSFWNVSRKVDYHAGGKWFIHGPKRHKENQLLSLKHSCWLSLV